MREFMQKIKADYLLSSVMCIVLGVVFVIKKASVLDVIGNVLAVALVLIGALYLFCYFLHWGSKFSIISGALILAFGLWFVIDSKIITRLIPIVIGVILLCHGMRGLQETLQCRKYKYEKWYVGTILSAISGIAGILCIFYSYQIMEKAIVLVGFLLIYNGISNIWISTRSTKAANVYQRTVDVEFNEDKE